MQDFFTNFGGFEVECFWTQFRSENRIIDIIDPVGRIEAWVQLSVCQKMLTISDHIGYLAKLGVLLSRYIGIVYTICSYTVQPGTIIWGLWWIGMSNLYMLLLYALGALYGIILGFDPPWYPLILGIWPILVDFRSFWGYSVPQTVQPATVIWGLIWWIGISNLWNMLLLNALGALYAMSWDFDPPRASWSGSAR